MPQHSASPSNSDVWGNGFGTETALLLACAFDDLHLTPVSETRSLNNTASARTMERAGLTEEGCIREHLQRGGVNKPVWLWWSGTGANPHQVDRCWQAFLRRLDVEDTFRLLKQTLGWTRPKLRDSQAADCWTWLVLAAHAQLRLARPLARDLRRPVRGWRNRTYSPPPGSVAGSGTCGQRPAPQPGWRVPRDIGRQPRQPGGPTPGTSRRPAVRG